TSRHEEYQNRTQRPSIYKVDRFNEVLLVRQKTPLFLDRCNWLSKCTIGRNQGGMCFETCKADGRYRRLSIWPLPVSGRSEHHDVRPELIRSGESREVDAGWKLGGTDNQQYEPHVPDHRGRDQRDPSVQRLDEMGSGQPSASFNGTGSWREQDARAQ